jgi:hypothetical protein
MGRALERLIDLDGDVGLVTRRILEDNGRGQMVPTGAAAAHKLLCRVTYQAGGVWAAKPTEAGLTIDTTPCVLASFDADLRMDDILEWRGRRFTLGPVTRPELDGGPVCTQAPLTEIKG